MGAACDYIDGTAQFVKSEMRKLRFDRGVRSRLLW